jgi:hypothetical protein
MHVCINDTTGSTSTIDVLYIRSRYIVLVYKNVHALQLDYCSTIVPEYSGVVVHFCDLNIYEYRLLSKSVCRSELTCKSMDLLADGWCRDQASVSFVILEVLHIRARCQRTC